MKRLCWVFVVAALSVAANGAPNCAQPKVATAHEARVLYLSVAKERGDKVSPEGDIGVIDEGDHWSVFQHRKPETKNGVTTVVHGGGHLEMEIDKCTGAVRTHYSK